MKARLLAGAAKVDITPAIGSSLSGFIARLEHSTGIADHLHARALILSHGERSLAIVQLDLLALSTWQVDQIREACRTMFGIPHECVLVSCTHTHSAPGMVPLRGCEVAPLAYQWSVIEKTVRALRAAYRTRREATATIASVPFQMGVNRRQKTPEGGVTLGVAPDRPAPATVEALHLQVTGGPSFFLFTHAAHPYVLGGESTLISGDFPSWACLTLEKAKRGTVAIFLNGCAGNIAPRSAFQGLVAARGEGGRLAEAVLTGIESGKLLRVNALAGESRQVVFDYQKFPALHELEAMVGEQERTVRPEERENPEVTRKIRRAYQDWATSLRRISAAQDVLLPAIGEVQLLQIGELAIIGISGEPFFEIGQQIARSSSFRYNWPLGYCNAYSGYLPPAAAYSKGGYEVNESYRYLDTWQIAPSSSARIVAAARYLLASFCQSARQKNVRR